uniref:Uncharacterized protein n=1 Tax=Salix viminalis TaxID=40686 RepID=A0A6N2KV33_SALVM
MGRAPCCSKVGLHRGPWTPREDTLLNKYIQAHGEGHWRSLPKKADQTSREEISLPMRMISLLECTPYLGNRWSLIAGRLPGRTDNEIKNYWNTHLVKRLRSQGTDPNTHKKLPEPVKREVKRRRGDKNTSKKKQNRSKAKLVPAEKHKVHLPKPFLFHQAREQIRGVLVRKLGLILRMLTLGLAFLTEDVHRYDLANGSDLECQSLVPTTNTLEKLYEECLQLLEIDDHQDKVILDSFADSLLV